MARKKKQFISQEYSASEKGKNLKEGTRKSRVGLVFATSFFSFALIVSVVLIAFTAVFFFSEVHGSSMMTALNPHYLSLGSTDSVIVNRHRTPDRGDIVIIQPYPNIPERRHIRHIKRVIAIAHDRIYLRENSDNTFTFVITDEPLNEQGYLDEFWGSNIINSEYRNRISEPSLVIFPVKRFLVTLKNLSSSPQSLVLV